MARPSAWYVAAIAVLAAACAADGRTLDPPAAPSGPAATTTSTTTSTTSTTTAVTTTTAVAATAVADPVIIERLSSPANATAEVVGTGGRPSDEVTVDGDLADLLSFEVDDDGGFVARVWIADEGAHTVCVADACGRVYTLAPDAETPEEVVAKIEQALVDVDRYLDVEAEFPDWSVEIGGALAGTGGSTDVDTHTITIYRNRGRSVDEFVRTILHEFGHAADFDRLDDDERVDYLRLRGIDTATVWRDPDGHRIDDWSRQPGEDFAEAMVVIWSDGRWISRTDGLGPPPDASQLAAIAELVAG